LQAALRGIEREERPWNSQRMSSTICVSECVVPLVRFRRLRRCLPKAESADHLVARLDSLGRVYAVVPVEIRAADCAGLDLDDRSIRSGEARIGNLSNLAATFLGDHDSSH
jgi:hypothetical protein